MAVVIRTASEHADARGRVAFCYLCGKPLGPSRNKPQGAAAEHIIPMSMLPPQGDSAIPAMLWVHGECDGIYKRQNEQQLSTFQRMHEKSSTDWHPRELGQIKSMFANELVNESGSHYPVVSAEELMDVAMIWITGFHALLYGTQLEAEQARFVIHPPVPAFHRGDMTSRDVMHEADIQSNINDFSEPYFAAVAAIGECLRKGKYDQVSAWNRKVHFTAAWIHDPNGVVHNTSDTYGCFWALEYPSSIRWSLATTNRRLPWAGFYSYPSLPVGATMLNEVMPP